MSQNKLIKVNTHELSSLKAAILEFKSQMSEIYKTGELIHKVGGFISHKGKLFQNSDLADKEQIKAISKFGSINAPSYAKLENLSELQYEQLNRDDVYLSFSHIVVFQNALEYPELKDLVLEFCRELIEYSIEVDSSNELFFSRDSYFGIYILVLLVEKYPEFAYMIGEFISKNSDYNQIKYHCAPYVTYLFDKYRYGQIFIDIFTNCRFQELYIAMGEDYYDERERFSPNILKYLLEDEKKYTNLQTSFI